MLGVASATSPFDTSSPGARAIADLFTQTLGICALIFIIVAGLIGYCVVRFRERAGSAPAATEGNKRLEIAWTVVPLLLVVGIFALTARTMSASDPPPDREPDLVVTAHQWWWEARYRSGAVTANEIHIPVGKPLVVGIESQDVVHDFWVPDLARKIDATPGRSASIWLQADKPGTYLGTCAEYCGAEHAWMRIVVVAEAPERFAAWERHQVEPAAPPSSAEASRGLDVLRARTCINCHDVAGAGAGARVAPDLTHLAERSTLGAGVIPNTAADLRRWLERPSAIKPASHMPDVQLTEAELGDLVAYLETLR